MSICQWAQAASITCTQPEDFGIREHVSRGKEQAKHGVPRIKPHVGMSHGMSDVDWTAQSSPNRAFCTSHQSAVNSLLAENSSYLNRCWKLETSDNRVLQNVPVVIDLETISCTLRQCTFKLDLHKGRQVYLLIVDNGLDSVAIFSDHLVHLFASSGSFQEALSIFQKSFQPTLRSWHLFISGCIKHGENTLALEWFHHMQQCGVQPNDYIYSSILKLCGSSGSIEYVKILHDQIAGQGLASNLFVGSTLIDVYAKCDCLDRARQVFDELPCRNVVAWNTMIGGYVKQGHGGPALELFDEMLLEGIPPDRGTFLCALKACITVGSVKQGMFIHSHAIGRGLELNSYVGSALVDMYTKVGNLDKACKNFQKLLQRDVVSWGAIISGHIQHGDYLSALALFDKMQGEGIEPDIVTWSCAMKACSGLGAVKRGKQLHEQVVKYGHIDKVVVSTLIEMYANCGNVNEAQQMLDDWPNSGVESWGAMIAGYASHGNYGLARRIFERMQRQGFKPNEVIYTSMLDACCHTVKVKAGCEYFKDMQECHHLVPGIEHFGCMVDLLGRAGYLEEAEELLELMPIVSDVKSWTALLSGCQKHTDLGLGRHCFNQVVRLDPATAVGHAIIREMYVDSNMWENVKEIEDLRRCLNAWKKPGKAWIEVDMKVHEFIVDGRHHPQLQKITSYLSSMRKLMEKEGYVPERDMSMESSSTTQEKEDALFGHCEKLAIAFGLLSLPQGETIRVTKNLRMCSDCHTASKVLAKIEQRHIIVRDEYCVHHFRDGMCSCEDHWLSE